MSNKENQKNTVAEASSNGTKIFIFATITLIVLLVVGMIAITDRGKVDKTPTPAGDMVENGKQVITINTKGGYSPNNINAKAGSPAILRFATNNTYDCSTALVIKQLNVSKNLPPNGNTDIEVPAQTAGSQLKGTCSMGMYSFVVNFN